MFLHFTSKCTAGDCGKSGTLLESYLHSIANGYGCPESLGMCAYIYTCAGVCSDDYKLRPDYWVISGGTGLCTDVWILNVGGGGRPVITQISCLTPTV